MPVRMAIQTKRPSTCCSSGTANVGPNGVRQHQQAWMAFQKQRSFTSQADQNAVATPMSWPGCMRPPAGLGTLEASFRQSRLISTAQPAIRRGIHGMRLPPMNESQKTKTKDTKRGSRYKNKTSSQKEENMNGFSARKWANIRSTQIHADDKINIHENEFQNPQEFKRAFPVPRQKKREKVVSLSEREAGTLRRLQGIYANTKERNLRVERIQQTLKSLQDKTLHTEMGESLREYQRRVEIDKGNRLELKRVRENYYKDKKRRNSRTHISSNALDTPQVSRHAYGLPEEGKEFKETQLVHETEVKLQEIWQKAVRRAIVIDKLVNHAVKTNHEVHLPKIKVKRSPPAKHHKPMEDEFSDKSESHNNRNDLIDVAMTELDALSSVGSDSDDDLTDIGEED